ncbi:MAG: hypothetical protein ACI90V_010141 [Bacillariaceae sp.]|jgi:hypothetical protein
MLISGERYCTNKKNPIDKVICLPLVANAPLPACGIFEILREKEEEKKHKNN